MGLTLVAALLLLTAGPVDAQIASEGTVRGVIRDAEGGVLPGVTVTAVSPTVPGTHVSVSESDGQYRLLNLPPGVFDVVAELAGFTKYTQQGVEVRAGLNLTLDIVLTLGSVRRERRRQRRAAVARIAEADSGRQRRRRFPAPAAAVDPTRRDRRARGHSGGDGPQPHRQQRDPDLHAARHGCRAARGADRRGRHGVVSSRTHGNRQAAHQCRGGFPGEDRRRRCVGAGGAGRGVQRDDQGWHQPAFRDRGSPSSEPRLERRQRPARCARDCRELGSRGVAWGDRFGPIARGSSPRISISIATVRSHAPRPN